ncbi:MAG: B12-binding domain-containing radical SAM protein [Candidatus Helarchaeota archaeon]|nr:B12-binding domain-containing radical SAM protein [Candidatus Helarchaeota archaeon]
MKILIVDALGSERGFRRFTRDVIGAGPRMVAGILEKFVIDSKIITAEQFLRAKKTKLTAEHLFVSAMTMDYLAVKRIIQKWNALPHNSKYNPTKILGGPITAALSKSLLNLDFDIGIIGEAEGTLSDLINANIFHGDLSSKALEPINGIVFRSPHGITENPKRPFLSKDQLNSFQASTKRIQDYPFYRAARIFVECVRGCSNFARPKIQLPDGRMCNDCGTCSAADLIKRIDCPLSIPPGCGYCSVPSIYGPPRSRTIHNIITEIKELVDLGAIRINLGASDFLDYQRDELVAPKPLTDPRIPPPNYHAIEQLLSEITNLIAGTNVNVFIENMKASLFTIQAAALISNYLPNTVLSIGAETGSKIHSKLLGRSSPPNEILNAIKIAKNHNLRVHTYFIHGLPGQTLQTAIETRRFMKKLTPYIEKITIYKFKPLPMSAFEDLPLPPSASLDKSSKIIADTAIEINREKKGELIGTVERVIVSELSKYDKSKAIGYPLRGGPTILIDNATDFLNKILTVKIDTVLSDKLVGGHIISK